MTLRYKTIIFGMIGAFIGAIPISILKYLILDFLRLGWFCELFSFNIFSWGRGEEFTLTSCGVFTGLIGRIFVPTLLLILFGGGLFGFLGARLGYERAEKRGFNLGIQKWSGAFWWSFISGALFDFLFIFITFYFGQ